MSDAESAGKHPSADRAELDLEPLEPRLLLSGPFPTETIEMEEGQEYSAVAGRVLVGFDESGSADALLAEYEGARLLNDFSTIRAAAIGLPDGTSVQEGMSRAGEIPGVRSVEPDYVLRADQTLPNDARFDELWGMDNTGQAGGTTGADIDAPEAWSTATGSADVTVGVIDSGVDYTHPDLAGNIWTNPGEIAGNGVDDDGNGFIDDVNGWDFFDDDNDPMDENGHGTHVAGTVGAVGNNGIGVAGVSWDVSIAALRFLGPLGFGSTSDAIDAVQYATQMGFDLTNNSWGGGPFSGLLRDAIEGAGDVGQLFVAAAGNDAMDNDLFPAYPASYDLDNIISVASTTNNDELSSFSNWGELSVDLGAPGGQILPGDTEYDENDILSTVPGGGYDFMAGTSMASPHVAGAAALMKSVNPGLSVSGLKGFLMQGTDSLGSLQGLVASGGRLNVANSLSLVPRPVPGKELIGTASADPSGLLNVPFMDLDYTVTNIGDTAVTSDFTVGFWLSDDAALDSGDRMLGEDTVTTDLSSFQTFENTVTFFDLPQDDPFGTDGSYNVLTVIDADNDVPDEVDKTDNTIPSPVTWDRGTVFYDDFSTDRGWSGFDEDRWERGPATAGGGIFHGNPDPGTDTTPMGPDAVLGYNIGGDYEAEIPVPQWVTSPAIDLSNVSDVALSFQRWLNVEQLIFDQASIQVFDGSEWVAVFENTRQITDAAWVRQNIDVSAYADGNPEFRVRFGMGPTDFAWEFSGWNIDDFQVLGEVSPEGQPPVVDRVRVLPPDAVGGQTTIEVDFSENMAQFAAEDPANYSITDSWGGPVSIDDLQAGLDSATLQVSGLGTNDEFTLNINGDEPDGLTDSDGNPLDGDADGVGGDDFVFSFALPGVKTERDISMFGGRVTFYDTDAAGVADLDVRPTATVLGNDRVGITHVILEPQFSEFGVAIEQKPGSDQPINVIDQTSESYPIRFIAADGDLGFVSLGSELTGAALNGMKLGWNLQLPTDVDGDGDLEDRTALAALGDVQALRSAKDIWADVSAGEDIGRALFGNAGMEMSGDLTAGGDLGLYVFTGSERSGDVLAGGRIGRFIDRASSDISGRVEAGDIGIMSFGPEGTPDFIHSDSDIDFLRSAGPIGSGIVFVSGLGQPVEAGIEAGGHIGRIIALDGVHSPVSAGSGMGLLFSLGNVSAPVEVTGDLGRMIVRNGNLGPSGPVFATVVTGGGGLSVSGDAGAVIVNGGSVTGGVYPDAATSLNGFFGIGISVGGALDLLSVRATGGTALGAGVSVGENLGLLRTVGDVAADVNVGGDGDAVVVVGDVFGDHSVGGDLNALVAVGDLHADFNVGENLNRVNVRGDMVESELDVGDRLRALSVVGDMDSSSVTAGGPLDSLLVRGDFVDSNVDARTLGRVTVGGAVESTDGDFQIHASAGVFNLFAEGVFSRISEGSDRFLAGEDIRAWVGGVA